MTNKQRERQTRNGCMILYREEGHTLKEVAELFHVSQTTARTVCGGETKAEKEKRNEDMRLYKAQGHTAKEVADHFGVCEGTAKTICRGIAPQRAGIEPPNKGKLKGDDEVASFIAERLPGFEYAGNYTGGDGRVDLKCKECGTILNRSMITVRHRLLDCPECKRIEAEKQEANREANKSLHKWFNQLVADIHREEKKIKSEEKRASRLHPCSVCGKLTDNPKFCSKECYKTTTNYIQGSRDRLNKSNIIDRDITLKRLYKKEWGVCYLCGDSCDWYDYDITPSGVFIAGDLYPSIDHVIPLAKGGMHSWDNVRLAHRQCNSKKSARVYAV